MIRDFPLAESPTLVERARRWLAEPGEGVPTRPAATVMFVRDADDGVEVFMLKRVATMEFAPSMMVFPGGGVDPRDENPDLPWAGPSPAEWATLMGTDEASARMLVAAAVREVFEECGVLLASATSDGRLADVSGPQWRQIRDGLVNRELSLHQVLEDAGLLLRADLIHVKAHWLTPEFEPRRFDTWFFAAVMPEHQEADGETSEADHSAWFVPDDLLEQYAAGTALMLPPTVVCVEEIRDAASAEEFVAHADDLPLVMPEIVATADGPAMRIDD